MDLNTIPSVRQLKAKAPHVGSGQYLHKPLRDGKCIDCHNPHGSDYKYLLSAPTIGESCRGKCHELDDNVKYPHEPVADGKCNLCHDPHGSNNRYLLINNQKQLCFSCHEGIKADLSMFKYVHEPVAGRECSVCHEPHGSEYFGLLVRKYPSEFYAPFDISSYDMCFSCHREAIVLSKETDDLTNFRNGKTNLHYLHVNKPERGRTCRACHATHAGNEPKQVRKEAPYGGWDIPIKFEKTETGGSCSPGCHAPRDYDRVKPAVYSSANK